MKRKSASSYCPTLMNAVACLIYLFVVYLVNTTVSVYRIVLKIHSLRGLKSEIYDHIKQDVYYNYVILYGNLGLAQMPTPKCGFCSCIGDQLFEKNISEKLLC